MNNDYRILAENVRERLNPERIQLEKSFSDELQTISYSTVLTYVRLAMRGVEPDYTRISKEAGERVKRHLSATMTGVEFEYQGSVMTNTHIRSYSDVDLLTISTDFYSYDALSSNLVANNSNYQSSYYPYQIEKIRAEVNNTPYSKDALQELRRIRLDAEKKLLDVYTICDITKPKSIKITNTSLKRDVDIVVANWYDDIPSIINNKGQFRGVQVYNKETHSKGLPDYPFLSINRINDRGNQTVGRIKKMIRFLKNLKAKSSHNIELNSFDFNAICYDINTSEYQNCIFYQLVPVLYRQLKSITTNQAHADRVKSVDDREYIFKGKPEKVQSIRLVLLELEGVYSDLLKEKTIFLS
jgi:hypothetical protein